jgi:Flp pilus assembly pilin Flp
MKRMLKQFRSIWRDEHGGEILEYVLVAGLIVAAAVAVVTAVGGKVLARWNTVSNAL